MFVLLTQHIAVVGQVEMAMSQAFLHEHLKDIIDGSPTLLTSTLMMTTT
jgi:hypothetical protein